jgi:cytochrome c-type biogenesis protein CcmE
MHSLLRPYPSPFIPIPIFMVRIRSLRNSFYINSLLKKLTHESNISFISQIALRPEDYRGRRIRVAGYVKEVYKRVFHLCDENGNYCMRVKANDIPISELEEGDKLVAEGLFSYDSQSMRYELDLIALRHC